MASQFVETVMAQALAAQDPQNAMARDWMSAQTKTMQQELVTRKAETIEIIEQKLEAAIGRSASQAVIGAYEKLLAEAIGR